MHLTLSNFVQQREKLLISWRVKIILRLHLIYDNLIWLASLIKPWGIIEIKCWQSVLVQCIFPSFVDAHHWLVIWYENQLVIFLVQGNVLSKKCCYVRHYDVWHDFVESVINCFNLSCTSIQLIHSHHRIIKRKDAIQ